MTELKFTKILEWRGFPVYRHEIDEKKRKQGLWVRRKGGKWHSDMLGPRGSLRQAILGPSFVTVLVNLGVAALEHLLGPAHAGGFHSIFDQVLAGALDWATGNRPTAGQVFVLSHSGAVAIEVVWRTRVLRTGQAALGNALTDALDDLAEQDSQGSVEDPKVSASRLPSAHIGGLPGFLKHVHQIQDQSEVEFLVIRI